MPKAVVSGPTRYGGLDIKELSRLSRIIATLLLSEEGQFRVRKRVIATRQARVSVSHEHLIFIKNSLLNLSVRLLNFAPWRVVGRASVALVNIAVPSVNTNTAEQK